MSDDRRGPPVHYPGQPITAWLTESAEARDARLGRGGIEALGRRVAEQQQAAILAALLRGYDIRGTR